MLDICSTAVDRAKNRLGARASQIRWVVADVTANPELGSFDVWHDRAVFHFLTTPKDQAAYATLLTRTVVAGGHAVIATFALDGPQECSGLEVRRYDGQSLAEVLGPVWGAESPKTDSPQSRKWSKPFAGPLILVTTAAMLCF